MDEVENKEEKKYNIFKAVSWYTIGNILIKAVPFLLLPVFTSLLTTTDYGIYNIFSSYSSIFEVLLLLGVTATVRIAKFDDNIQFKKYVVTILYIPFFVSLFFLVAINTIFFFTDSFLSMGRLLWNVALLSSMFASIASLINAKLVIEGDYKTFIVYSIMNTAINIGLSLLFCFYVFKEDRYFARIYAVLVANFVSLIFVVIKTKSFGLINFKYVKYALILGIPLLFHSLATVLLTQIDKIMIERLTDYANVGIYGIAVTLTTIPLVIQTSFESAWTPWFYNKLKKRKFWDIRKMNLIYLLLITLMVSMMMLFSREIIHIFTDKDYWDSVYSLIPLLGSVFFEMLYWFYVNIEFYHKKTIYTFIGTLIALVINFTLDYIFIVNFGYIAAAYATTISKAVLFLIHYLFSKLVEKKEILNKAVILFSSAFICLLMYVSNELVERFVIRLIIGIVLFLGVGAFIFYRRKDFKIFLDSKKENENEVRSAYVCNTPFQIFNVLNIVLNENKEINNHQDLYLIGNFKNSEQVKEKLEKTNIFENIYFCKFLKPKQNHFKNLVEIFTFKGLMSKYSFVNDPGRKSYDHFYIGDGNYLGVALHYLSKDAVTYVFDDGIASYFGNCLKDTKSIIYKSVCSLFSKGAYCYNVEALLINNVDFCNSTITKNYVPLPKIDDDNPLIEVAKEVFSYKPSPYLKKRMIILGQPLEEKIGYNKKPFFSAFNDKILTNSIYRAHPRQTDEPPTNVEIDNVNNIWEIESFFSIDEDKVLIGFSSTAQITSKLLAGKEPYIIFLYDLFLDGNGGIEKEVCDELYEKIKNKYINKEKIYKPNTVEEFHDIINNILK